MCAKPHIKMLSGRNGIIYQVEMMSEERSDCAQIKT